nr:proto-oncogene Mas-like [Anolis sagrei ordinatus]
MGSVTSLASGNEYNSTKNQTNPSRYCGYVEGNQDNNQVLMYVTTIFTFLISSFGFMGNGIVICLLVFYIKRNHFTTYILNLSIADLGVVTGLLSINAYWLVGRLPHVEYADPLKSVFRTFFLVMYCISQFLLTVISIDRCACIFFPIWYRYHQPRNFSIIVCVVIWILIIPLFPAHISLYLRLKYCEIWFYLFLINAVLFTPGMTVTTVAILIKVCFISPQYKRGKILIAILLALLFFLLFALPMNIIQYLSFKDPKFDHSYFYEFGYICAAINSSVNPYIYFFVGRGKGCRDREKICKILQNIFKEEDNSTTKNPSSNSKYNASTQSATASL